MIRRFIAALILIVGFFPFWPPEGWGGEGGGPAFVEGEILVQFHEGTVPGTVSALHGSVQGQIRRHLPQKIQLVSLPPHVPVDKAIGIYRANPRVKHAEPNYIVHRAVTPNDQFFERQWHLKNTGQRYSNMMPRGTAGADIGAPEAWSHHTCSDQVVVAILDTGVDYLHPDLAANVAGGWNFIADNNDPMDDDSSSHGTHVAGIIGAVGNNSIGVSGVNWAVRIMPLKTLGANGSGTIADAIDAIDYAIVMGARVINASYGQSTSSSTLERQAIERAGAAGVLFVAAAGNSSSDNDVTPFYPASYPLSNIVAVAATDADDNLAALFSNFGATSVHLAAPGSFIYSTVRGGYGFLSGTSMAAPMVSGAAALLMSYGPELSLEEVRNLLLESSFSHSAIIDKVAFGRLDVNAALSSANLSAVPRNFRIIDRSADYLELAWDFSGNAETFELDRRVGFEDFQSLITIPATNYSFRDEGTSDSEGAYFYRVRALGADVSAWSCQDSLKIPPLAPENLQADLDQDGVLLSWEDHSQVEAGYEIERRNGGGAFQRIAVLPEDSIDYFDANVEEGKVYSYRVRALNTLTGPSGYSEAVTVTFPASSASVGDIASSPAAGGKGGGGGCFIATAAFGSELHPRVEILRQFRDEALLPHWWGRLLNDLYLRLSPPVARQIEGSEVLRSVIRSALVPVLWAVEWWMQEGWKEEHLNRSQHAPFAVSEE